MIVKKQVLIIGFVWPEPNSSAAGSRMMQLISLFQQNNFVVTFASPAMDSSYMVNLRNFGVEKVAIELNNTSFDEFISVLNPSVVVFDRFVIEEQFGWRVTNFCPSALKILDSEDLHCLRNTRQAKIKKGVSFHIEDLFDEDSSKRELASILRCDLTLVIAQFEMHILLKYFKIDPQLLLYFPLLFKDIDIHNETIHSVFQHRKDFVFIGNFWHEPNWDAILHLKKTIWPLIKEKFPKAIIRVYGAYPSQKVFDLHNKAEGFLVLGRAEDAQKVISEARVLLAPIRFGAGLKGKLMEAMQYGTPSITTSIGAESINGTLEWNGFIADEPKDIAQKAVLLYENEMLWNEAQVKGYHILKKRFLWSDYEPVFQQKITFLLDNLVSHRKANFMGALLAHHSMKSTEYMSRWIEEKNKKK